MPWIPVSAFWPCVHKWPTQGPILYCRYPIRCQSCGRAVFDLEGPYAFELRVRKHRDPESMYFWLKVLLITHHLSRNSPKLTPTSTCPSDTFPWPTHQGLFPVWHRSRVKPTPYRPPMKFQAPHAHLAIKFPQLPAQLSYPEPSTALIS